MSFGLPLYPLILSRNWFIFLFDGGNEMNWVTVTINGTEVSVAFDENSVHIYNAYPIKDDLKLRGYRWNPADKSWYLSSGDIGTEVEVLKNNLQSSPLPAPAVASAAPDAPAPDASAPDAPVKARGSSELSAFPDSYSVADLRNRIDRLIREGIRGNIWVRGVVASDVKNYKWASYLDLKDEDEKKNIFFRVEVKKQYLEKINRKLRESGTAQSLEKDLPVFCNVDVYLPLRNVIDVRLNLLDILPEYTQSKIRNQREVTLDTLKAEGILENQKQLILPAVISRIGLITSEQGTSIRDIMAGLHPYGGKYSFYFVDSRMEGSGAVDSIIKAVDYLENNSDIALDAVVIARGGGSEQSLSVFNDLRLCRKVCQTRIPILTAIGHEKDVSAIELCSWLTPTPATPSGMGKYLQNRYLNLQEQLAGTVTQLVHHFTNVHHREMEKIKAFLKNIPSRVLSYIKTREERFVSLTRGLDQSVVFTVRDQERRIAVLARRLLEGCRSRRLKGRQDTAASASLVLSRAGTLNQRELTMVWKTVSKLDFEKRHRDNRKQREDIRGRAEFLLTQALKSSAAARKDLDARVGLVRASDPQNILKKGFTLTLDEENRVIKSLKEFALNERAVLKFHDGSTRISKNKEES
jgi:exodeoxyribonuclease VII large subunit